MNPYTKRGRLPSGRAMRPSRGYRTVPNEPKTTLFIYRALLKDTPSRVMFVITSVWVGILMGIVTIGSFSDSFNDFIDSINTSDTNIESKTIDY